MKHTVLCVDDEPNIVEALERLLRRKYSVITATSGEDALKLLKEHEVDLIISDQKMPKMSGVEFLKKSLNIQPNCVRILLTGYTDIESAIEAINKGEIYRYISKPWDNSEIQSIVDQAVDKYQTAQSLKIKTLELEKAYEELKSLDTAKTQFMYLINHELKTPLTSILSYLEILMETQLNPEQLKFSNRIMEGADKLQKLVDDVLILIKAESGLLKPQLKKQSLKKIISDSFDKRSKDFKKQGLKIKLQLIDDSFNTDSQFVSDVVDRIVDNSIKFSNKDSQVECTMKNSDGQLEMKFTNNGKIILQKNIDKILNPFTLDENYLNHSQGNGLGLSICTSLLKSLGGNLKIDSSKEETSILINL